MADNKLSAVISFLEDSKNNLDALAKRWHHFFGNKLETHIGVSKESRDTLNTISQTLDNIRKDIQALSGQTVNIKVGADLQKLAQSLTDASNAMGTLAGQISNIGKNMATSFSQSMVQELKNIQSECKKAVQSLGDVEKAQKGSDKNLSADNANKAAVAYHQLYLRIKDMMSLRSNMVKLGIDVSEIDNAISKIKQLSLEVLAAGRENGNSQGMLFKDLSKQASYKNELIDANRAYRQSLKEVAAEERSRKEAQRALKQEESERSSAIRKLETQLKSLLKLEAQMSKTGYMSKNTAGADGLRQQQSELEKLRGEINKTIQDIKNLGNVKIQNSGLLNTIKDLLDKLAVLGVNAKTAMQTFAREQSQAAAASSRLTAEQQRLGQAFQQANQQGQLQSRILGDLHSMAAQYVSVWGAGNFIKEVAQVTGELELQRKSLEVIIGSASKAGELYGEIRDLSQMSPYTFQDLIKSTRQLAAFGVQTKDLYGRMEALSNIGAGLSVDVSRLILAYGHTKSYGYLSGIQNRQFETAGIDMVGALADRYNRLAREAAGAGEQIERVSRKDVFKMIHDKAVQFEDVDAVLMELTQPGGKFYNMQQEQYNTIGGKLRNLRNNYNIMLSEIGESNHGALAFGVDTLNQLTANWEKFALVLKSILIPLAAVKLGMFALGTGASKASRETALAIKNMAVGSSTSGMMFPSKVSNFTQARQSLENYRSSLQKAYETGQLTNRQIYRQFVLNGQLHRGYRSLAADIIHVDKSQKSALVNSRGWRLSLQQLKFGISNIGIALNRLGNGLSSFFSANWFTLAFSAVTYLYQRLSSMSQKVEDVVTKLRENGSNDKDEAQHIIDKYAEMYDGRGFTNLKSYRNRFSVGGLINHRWQDNEMEFDREQLKQLDLTDDIEELKQKLQALSPVYDVDLIDVERVEEQADQFIAAIHKIDSARKASQYLEENGGLLQGILDDRKGTSTWIGRWTTDDLITDLQDYSDDYQDFLDGLGRMTEEELAQLDTRLGGVLSSLKEDPSNNIRTLTEALLHLVKVNKMSNKGLRELADTLDDAGAPSKLTNNLYELATDVSQLGESFENTLPKLKDMLDYFADDNDAFRDVAYKIWSGIAEQLKNIKNVPQLKEIFMQSLASLFSPDKAAILLEPFILPDIQNFAASEAKKAAKAGNLNDGDTEGLKKLIDDTYEKAISSQKTLGAVLARGGEATIKRWKDTIRREFEKQKNGGVLDWQKEFFGVGDKKVDTEIQINFRTYYRKAMDSESPQKMWEIVQKEFDEAKKRIESVALEISKHVKIKWTPEMLYDPKIIRGWIKRIDQFLKTIDPSETLHKTFEEILDDLKKMEAGLSTADANSHDLGGVEARKKAADEAQKEREKANAEAKRKAQEAERKAREAAEKARREQEERERKALDGLKEEVRIIKEAHSEYEKYRKTRDKVSAQALVMSRFNDEIKKGIIKKEYISDAENYDDALRKVGNRLNGMKWSTESLRHSAENLGIQINKTLADIDLSRIERMSKHFTDSMSEDIDQLTKQWQLFDELLKLSGDWDLADKLSGAKRDKGDVMSGVGNLNTLSGILFESLRPATVNKLSSKEQNLLTWFSDQLNKSTSTDAYIKLNDILKIRGSENRREALMDEFKRLFDVLGWQPDEGQKDTHKADRDKASALIDGLMKLIDEIVKTRESERENSVKRVAEIAGGVNNILTKRERILNQFTQDYGLINAKDTNGNYYITDNKERNKATELAEKRRDYELFLLSDDYQRYFNSLETLTNDEVRRIAKYIREQLATALKYGLIDAKTYDENMTRVNEIEGGAFAMPTILSPNRKSIQERIGSFWYNRDDDKNKKAVQGWQSDITRMLGSEYAKPWEKQDLALIDVLKKLQDLLSKEQQGTATAADRKMAGQLGQEIQKWDDKNYDERKGVQKQANDYTPSDDKQKKDFDDVVKDIINSLKALKDGLDFFADFFDSLGMEGASNTLSDASTVVGGALNGANAMGGIASTVSQIAPALGNLGPYGAAAGAALGVISGIAQAGDAKRQRQIEALRRDVQQIDNTLNLIKGLREQTLGYDQGILRRLLYENALKNGDGTMAGYYARGGLNGSGYEQELNAMKAQRQDYQKMYDAENGKKKKSKEDLEEYKSKMAELDMQIMQYTQNLAKELWSIDLSGWASQIGDALMTAFENGTNAADAFRDSVQDIMKSVVKSMMIKGIIEPMFEELQEKLFGKNGTFDISDPKGSMERTLDAITDFMNGKGKTMITAAQEFYNSANNVMDQNLGYGMDAKDSSKNLSNSISSTASEETMGIVAGYMSRMSQDLAVNRIVLTTFVNDNWPSYIEMVTGANSSLTSIDHHTERIMIMMQDGQGALFERVDRISRRMDNIVNGIDKVYTR